VVRPGSVRAVRAVGQDGLAIRTGQLRSIRSRFSRATASLSLHRRALVLAVRGPAPRGASSDGPPSPHRLEQPSPRSFRSLTPLCRRPGTAAPVPFPAGSWRDARLATVASRSPVRLRPPPCRALRFDRSNDRDAFRRVSISRLFTGLLVVSAHMVRKRCTTRAPFSPRSRRRVRQHLRRYPPRPAPWSPSRLATSRWP
jgi:hypothetical protein